MIPYEGGVRVVGAGGAYRRPYPLLPYARCGGRSVNLNAAFSASLRVHAEACQSYQSVFAARVSVNLSEKEQLDGLWFLEVSFAVWDLVRCQTRNARRDVQTQTWKQTAAPECNSR